MQQIAGFAGDVEVNWRHTDVNASTATALELYIPIFFSMWRRWPTSIYEVARFQ